MNLRLILLCKALILTIHVGRHRCHSFVIPGGARKGGHTLVYAKPLVSEGDWTAYLDEEGTGFIYYFNANTGESLWEKPTPTFPSVSLDDALQRTATQKQEAYLNTLKKEKTDKKGFFQTMLDTPPTTNIAVETEQKKEEKDWFGLIFDSASASTSDIKSKPEKEAMPVDSKDEVDWFTSFLDKGNKKPVEEETGIFGKLFGSSSNKLPELISTKKDITPKPSQAMEKQKDQLGDLFGGMVDKFASATASSTLSSPTKGETMKPDKEATKSPDDKKIAKELIVVETPASIKTASYVLPHPDKVAWGGEDAVFIKGRTFGVFDGVSGASKTAGKPLYSKILAREMKALVGDNDALTTKDLIQYLTQSKEVADKVATGASTAIVASIDERGTLQVLNVGDSGCIVIRDNKVVAEAPEIIHYFECPYQLADFSPDKPKQGKVLTVPLRRGDLVLMASDGVFDNFSNDQVLDVAMRERGSGLGTLAKRVVELSRKNSLDSNAATPYAIQAKKYKNPDYLDGLGGKVDDVSCVVVSYA